MADLGDLIPLGVEVRDVDGVLANSTAIELTITRPDGTALTPTPSNPSVGRYEYLYVPTMAGRYAARWVASGLNSSAFVDYFDIRPADPGALMSLADAKRALNIPLTATDDDEEIRSMVESVTALIEDYRGEVIVRRPIVESFSVGRRWPYAAEWRAQAAHKLLLAKTPVLSVTSIVRPLDGVTWTSSDVLVTGPGTGAVTSLKDPFWGDLTASYVAGYQVVPANFIEAAKITLRHLWQVQQTPGMGGSVFGGGDTSTANPAYALPNRAAQLLGGRAFTVA